MNSMMVGKSKQKVNAHKNHHVWFFVNYFSNDILDILLINFYFMKIIWKIFAGIGVLVVVGGIINTIKNQSGHQPATQQLTVQTDDQSTTDQAESSESLKTTTNTSKTKSDLILRDVKYGTDKRNTMNVLVPKGSTGKTPFILFMHGGAWVSGDKNDVAIVQLALGGAGIASASINYRYASDSVHYPELMSDVNSAVDYIVAHGKDWNVNTNKMSIGGISAGAHMALLYAYHYDTGNHINSVISMAGPTDLTNVDFLNGATLLKLIDGANKMVGAKYEFGKPVPSQFKAASPIQYVKNIPTLIIHGTGDIVVPYAQAELLSDTLKQKSYTHDLMTIDGANHDLGLGNQATAKKIADRVVEWVKEYNK
jgi:acetyl esterase/lipase